MSGADLEYQAMLARANINPLNAQGYDAARLEQLRDVRDANEADVNIQDLYDTINTGRLSNSELDSKYAQLGAVKNIFTGKAEYNGGFVNSYDTDVWIAGPTRTNPTNNSQGLYIQHRVSGNLGGLVHDAGASELRLFNATNTGTGQSAHENSLVVTGGVNNIGSMSGSLANFHATGTPTGTIADVALFRGTQIPPLPAGLTIDTAYGLYLQPQIVGTKNYSIFAPDGDSVLGVIRPKDIDTSALRIKGLAGQNASLLGVMNSSDTTLFSILSNGTVGVGSSVSGTSLWVNNNLTNGASSALILKAHSTQSVDMFRVNTSADAVTLGISLTGVRMMNTSLLIRNTTDTGTFFSVGPTGPRWNDAGLQQTTVGGAGVASALPATPTKYLRVLDSAGTTLVIPAYAAA